MTLSLSKPVREIVKLRTLHRRAKLWHIERTDGTDLYYTDHNAPIAFGGEDYLPSSGGSHTAIEHQSVLRPANMDMIGFIDDAAITHEDLRAGLYDNSTVTVYIVDWLYPWLGELKKEIYLLQDLDYGRNTWTATLVSFTDKLLQKKGRVLTRNCSADLGDNHCTVDLTPLRRTGSIDAVTRQGRRFRSVDLSSDFSGNLTVEADGVTRRLDGWFSFGKLTWTSGANDGLSYVVKSYTETAGGIARVNLWLSTAYPMVAGDAFVCEPGCNKRATTCRTKFIDPVALTVNNIKNFQGFPHVPGTDGVSLSPNAK